MFMYGIVQTMVGCTSKLLIIFIQGGFFMTTTTIAIEPVLSLVIGILILLVPRFLNYLVAIYLIIIGILGMM